LFERINDLLLNFFERWNTTILLLLLFRWW